MNIETLFVDNVACDGVVCWKCRLQLLYNHVTLATLDGVCWWYTI